VSRARHGQRGANATPGWPAGAIGGIVPPAWRPAATSTMRLLLVSDLHYALRQYDWLHTVGPDFDLVVLAGDHLDISSAVPVQAQVTVVLGHLRRLHARARIVVCSGNHDLNARGPAGEKRAMWMQRLRRDGIPSDGQHLEAGGALVTICPWWDGPATRAEVGAQLERDAARGVRPWVWLYHSPPEGPLSWTGKRHFGDPALAGWVETYRPDLVFCGHIHQAPFRDGGSWVERRGDTWLFNAGRQIGPVPAHVILDLEARTAEWYSLAGAERVSLDAAQAERQPLDAQ
jgi:Icc-related predicted phosphoesterase